MTTIMLIFISALFFAGVGTPLIRKVAIKSGFIATPKADRLHTEPTALMGGLAIYGGTILALLLVTIVVMQLGSNPFGLSEFVSIIMGASLMTAIGLWDDRQALRPAVKLGLQFITIPLVFVAGVRVQLPLIDLPFWDEVFNFVITAFWILFITNAVNYLDNADGIAIMTSAATSAIFMLIAILNDQQLVSVLAAAVLGASLGFARYNLPLPKSTIFMGDSGSLFLGYLLAILGIKIRIPANAIQITWMVPLIVLGLPIFDTMLVLISRTRRGVSFFRGGVDHTTHRLARLGLNGISVALTITVISGALGLIAIFITHATLAEAYVVLGSLVLVALYMLWKLELQASFHLRTGTAAAPPPNLPLDSQKN